jgi:hypothetical protein
LQTEDLAKVCGGGTPINLTLEKGWERVQGLFGRERVKKIVET